MKDKFKLYLFCLIICTLSIFVFSQSCRMNYMRSKIFIKNLETNLDTSVLKFFGTASTNPISIASREGEGGIWINRKVLVSPRFEVYLRVAINNACGDSGSWAMDGWTLILSKTYDYLYLGGGLLGYYNIFNSMVTEFDFWHNGEFGDISSNSVSLHRCFNTYCNAGENSSTIQRNISPNYNVCQNMVYDIWLTYNSGEFNIDIGSLNYIKVNENLDERFDGWAYIGFTGFFRGNTRKLDITGSFICEDDYDYLNFYYYWISAGVNTFLDVPTIPAGSTTLIRLAFRDSIGLFIPHYNDSPVWNYSLNLNTNCGKMDLASFTIIDRYFLQASMSGCTKEGTYAIANTTNKGLVNYAFKIVGNGFVTLKFVGYNGNTTTESSACNLNSSNNLIFNFGSVGGAFSIDDFGGTVSLDFSPVDSYGNLFLMGMDVTSAQSQMGIAVKSNGLIVNYSTSVVSNGRYRISFSIQNIGTYEISSTKFPTNPRRYFMNVVAGRPLAANSSCSLLSYNSSPTLDVNVSVGFRCIFRDSKLNILDSNWVKQNYGINFTCNLTRTNALGVSSIIPSTLSLGTETNCAGTPQMHGTYNFSVIVGSLFTAPVQIGRFFVFPLLPRLSSSRVYNYSTNTFISPSTNAPTITYVMGSNNLFALDFADLDNTLFSDIGYNPNFNPSSLSGILFDSHNISYNSLVKFTLTTISNKQYFGVSIIDPTYMKRSSFLYQLSITLAGAKFDVYINVPVGATIINKPICTHALEKKNTLWIPTNTSSPTSFVRSAVSLGTIVLQTTDNNLFNYKLTDLTQLKTTITPSYLETTVEIREQGTVDGVYVMSIQTSKADIYKITLNFQDVVVVQDYQVKFVPLPISNNLTPSTKHTYDKTGLIPGANNISLPFISDSPAEIFFNAFDELGNNITLPPTKENNYLEIKISLAIEGVNQAVNYDDSTVNVTFNTLVNSLSIRDNYRSAGIHVITITSTRSLKSMIITYKVIPGAPSSLTSSGNLSNSKILKISQTSTLNLMVKDAAGNNVATQANASNYANYITVTAIGDDNSTYLFRFVEINQLLFRYSTDKLIKAANYRVSIIYNNVQTLKNDNFPCNDCLFTVVYDTFDISQSKLSVVLSKTILMSTNSILQVNNQVDKPLFNFNFFDSNGVLLEYVDQNSDVKASFKGPNLEIILNREWISTNQILWTFPTGVSISDIVAGIYELSILYNNFVAQKYSLQFLGDGKDSDAGNGDPNFDNTYFSAVELKAIAGNNVSLNIQFRTSQNLRVNQSGELSKFSFANSKNYVPPSLTNTVQFGAKKGEYIITITSNVSSSSTDPIVLSISYNGVSIKQTVKLLVKNGELNKIVVDPSSISSDATGLLKSGRTIDTYNIILKAYDKFDNIFEDIFDTTIFSMERIARLFNAQHETNSQVTLTASTNLDKKNLSLNVISRISGKVFLSSFFLTKSWQWDVLPGPVSALYTYGLITNPSATIVSGEKSTFKIFPRDDYNNFILLAQLKSTDYDLLDLQITQPREQIKLSPIEKTKSEVDGSILFTVPLYEAGNNIFKPVLKPGQPLTCTTCQLKVNFTPVVFSNSILKNGAEVWTTSSQNNLNKGTYPTFQLYIYDNYKNLYDYIPSDFTISVDFQGNQSSILFCTENVNGTINVFVCKDNTNRKNWMYLISTSGYTITIKNNSNFLKYPVTLIGTGNDSDASNGPIDVSKTYFFSSQISAIAGESSTFLIELRTADSKRKNYWYDNPNDNIKVSFSNTDSVYTSDVSMADKPGQYYVKVSSQKTYLQNNSNNLISLTIEGVLCVTTQVKFYVTPAVASSSYIMDSTSKNIPYGKLQEGNADLPYIQRMVFYDRFQNIANVNIADLNFSIDPPANKQNIQIQSKITKNTDNSISISISAIYSGTYILKSNYFATPYTFDITSGEFSSLNSLAKVPTTAIAGDTIKLYIIPYDANNNYIDPKLKENKFNVFYKYKDTNTENYVSYIAINIFKIEPYPDSDITSCSNCNAYTYSVQVQYRYQNYFRFTLGESTEIKCINCVTEVSPSSLVFTMSLFMKFDSSTGKFIPLTENSNEDNSKADMIYRIYPRDAFLNKIDTIATPSIYSLFLTDKDGKKYTLLNQITNSLSQPYIEFVKNDNVKINGDLTYNTLTGGNYLATFSNGTENMTKNIVLIGRPDDNVASNQEIEEQNTVINEMNLSFIAGQSGYLIIELRTVNNLRKNNWNQNVKVSYKIVDDKNNKLNIEDKSFTSNVRPAGVLGVFYVTVASTLARTTLQNNKLLLQIIINSKLVSKLEPELVINPAKMASAGIQNSYLKSENTLKDGNADSPLVFKTIGFDNFYNPTLCDGTLLQLSIIGPDKNRAGFTIGREVTTGMAIFTVDNKISGTYTINSDSGLLPQATFTNSFGQLDNSRSLVNIISTTSIAGIEASLSVTPKDQYGNNITPNLVLSSVSSTVSAPSGKILTSNSTTSNELILFKIILTEQGTNTWQILINNKTKDCSNCITNVNPSEAVPEKSVLSYLNDTGALVSLSNNSLITRNNKNPLKISVSFKDAYENLISIVPNGVSIRSCFIEGNNMDSISLDLTLSKDNKTLDISIPQSQEYAFRFLVSGSYSFYFTVFSGTQSFKFTFPLKLTSDINDIGYGNGKYVVEQTELSHTTINMIADSTFTINLKLRTAQMLYYNNDINPTNDIKYTLSSQDSSFKFSPYKRSDRHGDYSIDIYTTLSRVEKTIMKILVRDPNDQTKFKEIPISINLFVKSKTPPDNERTDIVFKPDVTLFAGKSLIIQFKLYDKYGNLYVRNSEIINNNSILVFQNDIQVNNPVIILKTDGITYEVSFIPTYPPRDCTITMMYKDSKDQTNLYKTPITTKIISDPFYPNSLVAGSNLNEMKAGEKLDVSVQFFDKNNFCVDNKNVYVIAQVSGPLESSDLSQRINYIYRFKSLESSNDSQCGTTYVIEIPDTQIYKNIGTYRIVVLVGDNNYEAKVFNQKIVPNVLDSTKFISKYNMMGTFDPGAIVAGSSINFTIQGNDKYANQVNSYIIDFIKIKIVGVDGQPLISNMENKEKFDYKIFMIENIFGLIEINLSILKANKYNVQYFYKDSLLSTVDTYNGPFNISVIPDECSTNFPNVDFSNVLKTITGSPTSFAIRCMDKYRNQITKGGEIFNILVSVNILSSKTSTDVKSKIIDNNDGTYRVEFIPPLNGTYEFFISLRGIIYGEKKSIEIKDSTCPSDLPYTCPNDLSRCVKNLTDCLSSDNLKCAMPTPFACKVNNKDTCVKSRTECDCPSDHIKCDIMKVCVPANRDYMCSFSLPLDCPKLFPKSPILCSDGICRSNKNFAPSQRVCPIGFVLCGDLTCRTSYSECAVYDDCPGNMIRCPDQSCVLNQKDCPSSITCSDPKSFVCPDGSCVTSEIFCRPLRRCVNPNPILCSNNSCVATIANCPKQISCGQERSLCQDIICKSQC